MALKGCVWLAMAFDAQAIADIVATADHPCEQLSKETVVVSTLCQSEPSWCPVDKALQGMICAFLGHLSSEL